MAVFGEEVLYSGFVWRILVADSGGRFYIADFGGGFWW